MKKNWKTTAAGVIGILFGAIYLAGEVAGIDIPVIGDSMAAIAALSAGFGNLMSKDSDG